MFIFSSQDPELAAKKAKEADAEFQKQKARQAFLENLYVLIAMIIIVSLAVFSVVLKAIIFPDEKVITFTPIQQQVQLLTATILKSSYVLVCHALIIKKL